MVDERLTKLKTAKEQLAIMEKERQESYIFWSIWKYYAQNYSWFDKFIHWHEIPWAELKYFHKDETSEIADGNFVTYEHGSELWLERKSILNKIELLEAEVDHLLESLFCKDEVSLAVIAPYYGASRSGVYNYMSSRPWFIKLKDKAEQDG